MDRTRIVCLAGLCCALCASRVASGEASDAKRRAEILRALSTPISFEFEATPVRDVFAHLREYTGIDFVVDLRRSETDAGEEESGWESFDEENEDAEEDDDLLTLKVNDMTLRNALTWICRYCELEWGVVGTVIYVRRRRGPSASDARTVVYPVSDLVRTPRNVGDVFEREQ